MKGNWRKWWEEGNQIQEPIGSFLALSHFFSQISHKLVWDFCHHCHHGWRKWSVVWWSQRSVLIRSFSTRSNPINFRYFRIRQGLGDLMVDVMISYLQSSRLISSKLWYGAEWLFQVEREFYGWCYFIFMLLFLCLSFNFVIN